MAVDRANMQNPNQVNQLPETSGSHNLNDGSERFISIWGFNVEDLYKIAQQFFKDKDGSKAIQISYKDRLHLIALNKQVSFGQFHPQLMPDLGLFDVVGNDRKLAWKSLDDMPKEKAMLEFISCLNQFCPLFGPFVTAHRTEKEEQERKRKETEEESEKIRRLEMEDERRRQMTQEMMIRTALNEQTTVQFRLYAEQQFPANKSQQDELMSQLQDQHFMQYMTHVYQQHHVHQPMTTPGATGSRSALQLSSSLNISVAGEPSLSSSSSPAAASSLSSPSIPKSNSMTSFPLKKSHLVNGLHSQDNNNRNVIIGRDKSIDDEGKTPVIELASLWTRQDVKEFKESLAQEPESFINVGSGETVTVRIPTHENGTCLFWEFVSDGYDVGFGVSFEWSTASSNQLTVHVTDVDNSFDKDENNGRKNPTDVIIPVYRRDSHLQVYCGSHVYPGHGVYLFIFDNSYSLWRSKSVFYRVYYTR